MGGCATKPKVLKDAPAPEPANDDKPSAAPEPPVVVVVGVTEGEKIDAKKEDDDNVKEIVDDDKRRSLSILFKENEEGKDSTEDGKPAVEPLKQEVPPVNIKPTYESETTLLEVEKTEILVEQSQQTPVPDVVVDHAQKREIPVELIPAPHVVDHAHKSETPVQHTNVESEKITESTAPTAETNTAEKKTVVPDVVYTHEKAETEKTTESTAPTAETKTAEKKTEVPDVEREKAVVEAAPTSEEKKKEAPDVGSAKEEVKAEKANEAAVGTTETQNYGTSEEKKTEVKGSHAPEEKAINV